MTDAETPTKATYGTGVCSGPDCGKSIIWETKDGRRRPKDAVPCPKCDGRGYVSVPPQPSLFDDEPEFKTREDCPKCKGRKTALRSHFDSCVNASMFRAERSD
jgi:predicted RNA-binding Zn-ribbon protein involved in translation (DUF1610 family)